MAVHKGCLYAGIGYWQDIPHYEDKPGDPWVGAQILVKDGKDTPWKVDLNMGERVLRARALRVVAFEADAQGNRLSQPVEILLASGMNFGSPEILVWSRDDKANQWHKVVVDRTKVGDYLVALGNHRDHVTGVSHVFGFIANPRGAPSWNRSGGAGLFVRRADGTYQHFPVEDPSLGPHPFLYATRDVASSPWEPNVIYACGYDATANAALKTRALNTAWIYKGTFK
jgi:hypothetical protein